MINLKNYIMGEGEYDNYMQSNNTIYEVVEVVLCILTLISVAIWLFA